MAQKSLASFFNRKTTFSPFELLPDAVAKHMSTSITQLPETDTVGKALAESAADLEGRDDNSLIFLTDEEDRFTSVLTVGELRREEDSETYLSELSHAAELVLKPEDSAEQAAQLVLDAQAFELPVIRNGRAVGVLTAKEARKILRQADPNAAGAGAGGAGSASSSKKSSGFAPLRAFFGARG